MTTLSTFIGLHVSIPLGTVYLDGVSVSDVTMALTKKYQKKVMNIIELVDIMTSALAVFEMSISKALKDGRIDEQKFTMLQTFPLEALNKLVNVDHKMETET